MTNGVCLIVNPTAGGGHAGRIASTVGDRLRARGLPLRSVVATGIEHARDAGIAAAGSGETVALLGGDGLIGAVADSVRAVPDATIALLPCGSGNDLARVLGIPRDPLAACEVIASGQRVPLDLGEVCSAGEEHGRAFVGIASFGFDSDANTYANEAPRRLGSLIYAYGALRALVAWRHATFTLEVDGERRVSFTGYSVAAANSSAYGGGMYPAPDARLDDGQLDLVYMEAVSKRRFLTILPKAFKGTHVHEPCVHVLRGRELTLSADRGFVVYADGDPIGQLPVSVRALPAAIGVLVPAATAASWRR